VNLFFILTTPGGQGFQTYAFIVLFNVGIFAIAEIAGLVYSLQEWRAFTLTVTG